MAIEKPCDEMSNGFGRVLICEDSGIVSGTTLTMHVVKDSTKELGASIDGRMGRM